MRESLSLVVLMLSDLAGKVLWVWRRRVWTRREWRTCNTVGQQTKRTTLGLTDYRLLNLKHEQY